MVRTRNNGWLRVGFSNWGLVLAAVIGAGVSIYAVADPGVEGISRSDALQQPIPVRGEDLEQLTADVAAFDPFRPEQVATEAVVASEPVAEEDAVELLAAAEIPDPTKLSEVLGEEPQALVEPAPQLAANNASPYPGGTHHQGGNSAPNGNKNEWGKGGKYGWVLPTALIAGGVTGITVGTVAIVQNNRGDDKKNPPLTQ